jgi:hypothetical protein
MLSPPQQVRKLGRLLRKTQRGLMGIAVLVPGDEMLPGRAA